MGVTGTGLQRMTLAYQKAVSAQSDAANPGYTRMVSANAGSGKTRVLVDRVSRILLQGVEPEKILCLTYTKAAATEMQDRLYDKLGDWSITGKEALKAELQKLTGSDVYQVGKARNLFAKALETPEGLKVQTIHAFCERVLSRFPIEAGIMPGFEPIEEAEIAQISEEVRAQILKDAMAAPDGELNQALQVLSVKMADQTLEGLFTWMSHSAEKIRRWEASGGVQSLADVLGLDPSETKEGLAQRFWQETDEEVLTEAIPVLKSGLVTDQKAAALIKEALSISNPVEAFYHYSQVFLTTQNTLRKSPVTKKTMEATQDYFSADGAEAARVLACLDKFNAADVLTLTKAIYTLAQPYRVFYTKAKRKRRGLDFNDQILLVRDLLSRKDISDWVRYKLDGGIEHILLDEAQDTSPEQWDIINSLSEAFIQDNPDRDSKTPRTLFAVGDEKQSIYGFQGAKPEQFLDEIRLRLTGEAKQVRMAMSFRSAQTVLDVVDAFLHAQDGRQAMFDAAFPPGADIENHAAFREDQGQVEFWPLSMKPEKGEDKAPWDTTPVDEMSDNDEREVLARELAIKIRDWLDKGEPIYDRDENLVRPMQAGDILILVRTRGGGSNSLYDAIIRHLKRQSIPLAGADRLKLADAMIVRDLLALSRFTLLPSDDLSLAEVLKGPIFGLDDMDLLDLARGRAKKSLWSSVRSRDDNLAGVLNHFIYLAGNLSPYEFFTAVLDYVDENGESLRRKFFKRLGLESREALDVFLTRAMDHQQKGVPSLQYFVRAFDNDDADVKRDMDAAKGLVRVMTVHGAKGLEAPVVILPDTTQTPKFKDSFISLENGFYLKPSQNDLPVALEPSFNAAKAKQQQEQLRLLYVALTRAESRLVICGFQSGRSAEKPIEENSWYDWMSRVFGGLETQIVETPFGDGKVFGGPPVAAQAIEKLPPEKVMTIPLWALQPAAEEERVRKRLSPSHLLASAETDRIEPQTENTLSPRHRGVLIHQLLEVLPNFAEGERASKAKAILSGYNLMTEEEKEELLSEVLAVLNTSEFTFLWGPNSRAEASLAGQVTVGGEDLDFSAQIDRLCVQEDQVLIIDYKSSRHIPRSQDEIDPVYMGQMAAYRELARARFKNKKIMCGLLWTTGPELMWLGEDKLDDALTKIGSLPTYDEETDFISP